MIRTALLAAGVLGAISLAAGAARAQEEDMTPPAQSWSFKGPFGTFDRASAQRGFQVWQQVCSNCHSMKEGYYRNLTGIGIPAEDVKNIAASVQVPDTNDDGQPIERAALPSDHFKSPYANEKAGRAANAGALPPDHSVIIKAREGGADYSYALLNGYVDPPKGFKVPDGLYYNRWFTGHLIHMPQPLHDEQVTYTDGTKATVPQMAADVTTFLTYMANPEMEQRKRLGVKVVIFLSLLTGVTYAIKRRVWADVH